MSDSICTALRTPPEKSANIAPLITQRKFAYRREVDGLRALAILPVILFHAGFRWCSGGFVGVDIFFVISGYLITSIILIEKETGTFSLSRFYERRARRILPALLFVLFVSLPFAWFWMTPYELRDFCKSLVAVALFGSNILFWRESGYFLPSADEKPLLHAWSLSVEEQFYLLFPLFLTMVWSSGRRRVASVLAVATVSSFLLGEWGSRNAATASFYLMPTRAWELLFGALIAFYLWHRRAEQRGSETFSLAGLGLITLAVICFDHRTPLPGLYATVPVVGAGLIIMFAVGGTITARVLSHPLLTGIGLISYSAYLWHQPLYAFARLRASSISGQALAVLALLSLACGWLSWKYIETPFRDKVAFPRAQISAIAILGSLLIVCVGVAGIAGRGFPNRFNKASLQILVQKQRPEPFMGRCESNNFERKTADLCLLGASDVKPSIILWGDSHAASLAFGLDQQLLQHGLSALQLTQDACPPVVGITRSWQGKPDLDCMRNNMRALQLIEEIKPDFVIVSARWTLNLTGQRFDNQDGGKEKGDPAVVVDQQGRGMHTADLLEAYRKHLLSIRERLAGKLLVVSQIPEAGWDVPKKALWNASHRLGEVKTRYDVFANRNQVTSQMIADLRTRGVRIVAPERVLCDGQYCYNTRDGIPLYFDDNHLSLMGSRHVAALISQELFGRQGHVQDRH